MPWQSYVPAQPPPPPAHGSGQSQLPPLQISPGAQSVVDRHCTQRLEAVLQCAPGQCASDVQATQPGALQAGVVDERAAHWSSLLQPTQLPPEQIGAVADAHWALAVQLTHGPEAAQYGRPYVEAHSPSELHLRQLGLAQNGVAAGQLPSARH